MRQITSSELINLFFIFFCFPFIYRIRIRDMPITRRVRRSQPRKSRKSRNRPRRTRSRKGQKVSKTRQTMSARPGYGMVRQPFAPNLFTTFSYTESIQLVQGTPGTPGRLQYRANSLWDPRVAIGGKKPRYTDTLLGTDGGDAPYDHYRVHAAKIVVTFWPESPSAGSANGIVAIIPERGDSGAAPTAPSTFDELTERPYCKKLAMTTLGSFKPRKIKHFVRMKTILGHKDLSDVDATASKYNTSPSEEIYFNIYSCAIDPSDALSPRIEICITYFAQLYNLIDVADS